MLYGHRGIIQANSCRVLCCHVDKMLRLFPLLGAPAAAGPQAAAERPAHQTCPEDHEVSASAQGKKHVIAVLLAKHQRRVCYGVANIQVEKPKHLHTNLCAEMLITHNVVWSGCD